MNKDRMTRLMQYANIALTDSQILSPEQTIEDSYNGQTAGFGVSIAMSGLLPTLAIYYQDASDSRTIDRRKILCAIGRMIRNDKPMLQIVDAETLLRVAMRCDSSAEKQLKREVIDCAIALKQVIRTYKLV